MTNDDHSPPDRNDKPHAAELLYFTSTRACGPWFGIIFTLFAHLQKAWLPGFLNDGRLEITKKREWGCCEGEPTEKSQVMIQQRGDRISFFPFLLPQHKNWKAWLI